VKTSGLGEAYLSGRLSESEMEEYERHLFECDRCTGELETLREIQAALSGPLREPLRAEAHPAWRRRTAWALAAAAVVVAVVGISRWTRNAATEERSAATTEIVSSGSVTPGSAEATATDWEKVADIRPAPYKETILRDGGSPAGNAFREGMGFYARGDFARAIPSLRSAAALDTHDAGAPFFLGVAQLMTGHTEDATASLQSCLARGDSPYVEEAHLYIARAFLRGGGVAAAAEELEAVIGFHGDFEAEARRLLETVRRTPARSP
jgi:hypothetical protein